ncbi:MAG: TorF family putative porin [Alphaproteobacteria bacterium]
MKLRILTIAAAAMIGWGSLAHAADPLVPAEDLSGELTGNVALTSEYFYRGLSQSGNGTPAVQGGLDYAHTSGLYVGAWGSNVDFSDARVEIDVYGGYKTELDSGLLLDVGGIYYAYPSADNSANGGRDLNFFEVYGKIGYDFGFALPSLKLSYSPDYQSESGDSLYTDLSVDVPLGKYFTLGLHAGYMSIDNNANWGTRDYWDYGISVGTNVFGLDLKAAFVGNDLPDASCVGDCERFIFTVSKAL